MKSSALLVFSSGFMHVFIPFGSMTFTLQKCNQSKDCIFCINLSK